MRESAAARAPGGRCAQLSAADFTAAAGLTGLTAVSVWWVKLGIRPERITPGKPEENGRHERMHRTMKAEACQPASQTLREQQGRFDAWRRVYNTERPHEALGQATPASVYVPAQRRFPEALPALTYPDADAVRWVRPNGTLRWRRVEVYLSERLAGEHVGLWQVGDGCWEVRFGLLTLGVLEEQSGRLRPGSRPRRTETTRATAEKVVPISPV